MLKTKLNVISTYYNSNPNTNLENAFHILIHSFPGMTWKTHVRVNCCAYMHDVKWVNCCACMM